MPRDVKTSSRVGDLTHPQTAAGLLVAAQVLAVACDAQIRSNYMPIAATACLLIVYVWVRWLAPRTGLKWARRVCILGIAGSLTLSVGSVLWLASGANFAIAGPYILPAAMEAGMWWAMLWYATKRATRDRD